MLPPGHIAASFLVGKIAGQFIPGLDQPQYLALTSFFGFVPDLDHFLAFAKSKKMIIDEKINHHRFITHAPIFYVFLFILWFIFFPEFKLVAYTFLLGTFSHLLIDTFASDGTVWLYPFSKKLYGKNPDKPFVVKEERFFQHWIEFVKKYIKLYAFKAEIIIIVIAIITLIYG